MNAPSTADKTAGVRSLVCARNPCKTMQCGDAYCQRDMYGTPTKSADGIWTAQATCQCPLGKEMNTAGTCVTSVVNCEKIRGCKKVRETGTPKTFMWLR